MLSTRAELVGAQADAVRTQSTIDAAIATADRLRSEIKDAVLVAPVQGPHRDRAWPNRARFLPKAAASSRLTI